MHSSTGIWRQSKAGVRLRVRVQARSSRDRVAGVHGDAIKVQVTAPPVGGAANAALVHVLASWLKVPRRAVAIVQGQSGRDKVVEIEAAEPTELGSSIERAVNDLVDKT